MLTKIGRVNFRNDSRVFGIKEGDRFAHMYVIGKTGVGKSSLLSSMALQDAHNGSGFCIIDPHGDMVGQLHKTLTRDHIYLDLSDPSLGYGYNPFKEVPKERISLLVSGFLENLKGVFFDAWGARMEHILRNALYALLETKGTRVQDILRLLSDKDYREKVAKGLSNEVVKTFWLREYPSYSPGYRQDGVSSIQNKLGSFLSDPRLHALFMDKDREDISLRRVMDQGGILLVNLAKGVVGSDSARILGGFLVSSLGLSAFSRASLDESQRKSFFLYIDEFQDFTTLSLLSMLSELRKYKVGMIMAHQYVHQLEDDIRHAIFGNVGTLLSFRVGAEDASIIQKELLLDITPDDLLRLPNYQFYIKMLIDGEVGKGFSGKLAKKLIN
jgi:Type IV secretion-system coupling protein DNA-binding domain